MHFCPSYKISDLCEFDCLIHPMESSMTTEINRGWRLVVISARELLDWN